MPSPRGPLAFECSVKRIEAFTDVAQDNDDEVGWSVVGTPVLGRERGIVYMLGHITVSNDGHWGQVQVQGWLTRERAFPSADAGKAFARSYGVGYVEELWDVARRALNVNAALLDCEFDLPLSAPHTEIDVTVAVEVPIEDDGELASHDAHDG